MRGQLPLGAVLALAATAALVAVVSLSVQQQSVTASALASLKSAGRWPRSNSNSIEPSYEPHVGDVLKSRKVRDFHPRRPGGRRAAADAHVETSQPPLVTARTERQVSLFECYSKLLALIVKCCVYFKSWDNISNCWF